MGGHAFVYGTLLADEVVRKLLNRVPPTKAATLRGFTRHRVKDVVYPAIVPSAEPSSTVTGKVLLDLTDKEIHVLDLYEADEYYRETVQPVLEDGTTITADVYIWQDKFKHLLLPEEWDYEAWRVSNLHVWVNDLEPLAAHPVGDT